MGVGAKANGHVGLKAPTTWPLRGSTHCTIMPPFNPDIIVGEREFVEATTHWPALLLSRWFLVTGRCPDRCISPEHAHVFPTTSPQDPSREWLHKFLVPLGGDLECP